MIDTNFEVGDVVVNKDFCEYEPFILSDEHFKGVSARNQSWFDSLEHSKMKLTVKQLIEEIENRKEYALDKDKECFNSNYYEGYSDALGELLEFIEDNR